MTGEQLAAVRLYTSTEVVQMLRLEPTWLKNWITDERVPHVRVGAERGVRFTPRHILEIGSMLPELLGGHRGGSPAGPPRARDAVLGQPTPGATAQQPSGRRGASAEAPAVVDIRWSTSRPGVSSERTDLVPAAPDFARASRRGTVSRPRSDCWSRVDGEE